VEPWPTKRGVNGETFGGSSNLTGRAGPSW
jgi:hypothetical protein